MSLSEVQFVPLQGQTNVYGISDVLHNVQKQNYFLLSTLKRGVCKVECKEGRRPVFTSLQLANLSGESTIIALDAYTSPSGGIIIAVASCMDIEAPGMYLNVYGLRDESQAVQWTDVAEDWVTIPLKCLPYKLTHINVSTSSGMETVFLLSGADNKVHMYQRTADTSVLIQEMEDSSVYFPELQDLPSCVTAMDFHIRERERFSTLGCLDGFVKCATVDTENNTLLRSWNCHSLTGPITVTKLFYHQATPPPCPAFIDSSSVAKGNTDCPIHLLVCSAVEMAVVFCDVKLNGFTSSVPLPQASSHDSILCCEIGDFDFDGRNEVALGTFGKHILIYKITSEVSSQPKFELISNYEVAFPIHGLRYTDFTEDGFRELVVISTNGVHMFQHNLEEGLQQVRKRLTKLPSR